MNEEKEKWMMLFNKAYDIACFAHEGQFYGDGEHYIEHVFRVSQRFDYGLLRVVAILHDALEDYEKPEEIVKMLYAEDCPIEVFVLLEILKKTEGETYEEYIASVCKNKDAVKVKIEDMIDNFSHCFDDDGNVRSGYDRLVKKYGKYLQVLLRADLYN